MSIRVSEDDASAPRAQAGASPQHLLATLLGEYLDSSDAELPSTAIVAMLREFDISEPSARTALSRLTKRGLIATRRSGRQPTYHITPQALARHRDRMRHFLSFGAQSPRWTDDWVVVSFSLPATQQAQRHNIRRTLTGLGFVRLYDSMWIRPGHDAADASRALHETVAGLDDARLSIMHARFGDETWLHGPTEAFDLAGLAAAYHAFIDKHSPVLALVRGDRMSATQALVARTSIMDDWRIFPDIDPNLPDRLLPEAWPRSAARELFLTVHSKLGPLAENRLVQITTPHWPAAASWITHFGGPNDPLYSPKSVADDDQPLTNRVH